MTFLPSNVQTGACSSSSTRSLKCVPLALSSLSWPVRYESGLVRVAVVMRTSPRISTIEAEHEFNTGALGKGNGSLQMGAGSEHNRVPGRNAGFAEKFH